MGKDGLEVQEGKKPYNPAAIKTDFEKRMIEKAAGQKLEDEGEEESEEVTEGEESEEIETEGEEDTEALEVEKQKAEEEALAKKERKEKRQRELENALGGNSDSPIVDKDEASMTETERVLARQLKEERRKNSIREESDALNKLLEGYTEEEQALLDPEIRKFLKDDGYIAMRKANVPVSKRTAYALALAKGNLADKLQETAEAKGVAKTEAKRKVEDLAGGPKKKAARAQDTKTKEVAALRKAAAEGDRRAQQKLNSMDDPILQRMIERSGA